MENFFWQRIHISDESARWRWAIAVFVALVLFPTLGSAIDAVIIGIAFFSINYWIYAGVRFNSSEKTITAIVFAYLACVTIGPFMNGNALESLWLGLANSGLVCLIIALPALRYCKVYKHKKLLVLAFPIAGFVMGAGLVVEAIAKAPMQRAELLSGNALILALLASISMLGCAVYGYRERKRRLLIFFIGFVLSGVVLLATGSRAPIAICFVMSIGYLLFRSIWDRQVKAIYFFAILILVSAIVGYFMSHTRVGTVFLDRSLPLVSAIMSGELLGMADLSSRMRFSYYATGWQLAQDNLLTGVGRANIVEEARALAPENQKGWYSKTHLHNGFLTELTSNGIVGLISLILLICLPIFISHNGGRAEKDFSWLLSAFISGYAMTNIAFYHDVMVFSFVGYCLFISIASNKETPEGNS